MPDEKEKQAEAQPGVWVDPYRNYNFRIEIQGVEHGHFTECRGLGVKVQSIRYREGGLNQVVHCVPGQVEYGEVTLSYGLTASSDLWNWLQTTLTGNVERRNVTLVVLDSSGARAVMSWELIDCWPCAWRGAPLDALGHEIAIESLTLVYERLNRV